MPDINSFASCNEVPPLAGVNPFKTELPGCDDIAAEKKAFCERLAQLLRKKQVAPDTAQSNNQNDARETVGEDDAEEACQEQIDHFYSLLPRYRQLINILRHELVKNMNDAEHYELVKFTQRKLHRVEQSYTDAEQLVKRMDFSLNGIQELDGEGKPYHNDLTMLGEIQEDAPDDKVAVDAVK
ncbi:hypothetical protein QFC22_004585 [Naganishia vaughanmartiniae]|uniref:Uncharacterized protein n=1 Tax=Naganishia vaughanmartiniae TaxID=1424756 RepID=A0ACC2X2D0_9TREE|nr:hypothetical protein QFC22_004585 [Naganishia vaughanmartiniae]